MKNKLLLLALLVCGYATVLGYDFDDNRYWDTWARNLNRDINLRVRSSLRGLKDLDNLGLSISQQVQDSLRPLDNLGETISQQVHQGLKPVREMEFKFKIRYGNGGTTVATFKNKRFVLRNGVMYECDGTISDADGSCSGTLSKVRFDKKEDFCFANVQSVINNWYCLGTGGVNSGMINNKVYCDSSDGSPILLISAEEYKNLCKSGANPTTYKYFTEGPLGEYGSDVQCSGSGPYVCTMTEGRNPGVVNSVFSSHSIHIN